MLLVSLLLSCKIMAMKKEKIKEEIKKTDDSYLEVIENKKLSSYNLCELKAPFTTKFPDKKHTCLTFYKPKKMEKEKWKNIQQALSLLTKKNCFDGIELNNLLFLCEVTKKNKAKSILASCMEELGKKITHEAINDFVLDPTNKQLPIFKIEKFFQNNNMEKKLRNLLIKKFPRQMQYLWKTNIINEYNANEKIDLYKLPKGIYLGNCSSTKKNSSFLFPITAKTCQFPTLKPVRQHTFTFQDNTIACIGTKNESTYITKLNSNLRKLSDNDKKGVWIPQKLNEQQIIMLQPKTGSITVFKHKTNEEVCSFKPSLKCEQLHLRDGKYAVTYCKDHEFISVWEPETKKKLEPLCIVQHEDVSSVHGPTSSGSLITFSKNNGLIKGWAAKNGLELFNGKVRKNDMVIVPNKGEIFITNSSSHLEVRVWDAKTGDLKHHIRTPKDKFHKTIVPEDEYQFCYIHKNGKAVFSSSKNFPTKIVDCLTKKSFFTQTGVVTLISDIDDNTIILEGVGFKPTEKKEFLTEVINLDSGINYILRSGNKKLYSGTDNVQASKPVNHTKPLLFTHKKITGEGKIWSCIKEKNGIEKIQAITRLSPINFNNKKLLRYLYFASSHKTISKKKNENLAAFNYIDKNLQNILKREKRVDVKTKIDFNALK